jgi:hypothetical protein
MTKPYSSHPRLMKKLILVSTISLLTLSGATNAVAANATPTLDLFPVSVKEQLRQTSDAAKAIETNIQGVIRQMDEQHELYKASKCDEVAADAGCAAIKRNINESYIEMLTQVETSLPIVESAMTKIKTGMESSLRSKIGLGMSPRELQAHIAGKRSAISKDRPGRKRAANLSSIFATYHQLISTNRDGSSIPTMAAGVYLDSVETLEYTAMIKQEIAIAKVETELRDIYSDVTPQMMSTVDGVKALLFGVDEGTPIAPADNSPVFVDTNIAELQIDL